MDGNVESGQIGDVLAVAATLTIVFAPITTRLYGKGERRRVSAGQAGRLGEGPG